MMTGYQPLFGSYALAGAPGTFANYLGGLGAGGANQYAPTVPPENWDAAVAASAGMNTFDVATADDTTQRFRLASLMQGENARRNALAMAGAYMGGGIGYGAQARQAALGNMYDIYGAREAGKGKVAGTFLNWLNTRMQG